MYHCQVKAGAKGKGASATKHADYIMREGDYKNHNDLEHVGYGNMPSFANTNAGEIWRLSDKYEGANRTVYRELELGFPLETKKQDRIDMVEKLMSDKFKGHAFTYAIHDKEGNPHAHVMFCDRKQDKHERPAEQFFMRANKKSPEKGGCAKAEELNGKDRGDHVEKIRKSWADRHNDFYKSIGSEERADHRTLVAQRDSFLEEAKQLAVFDKELAAEATRKAALLDRPADKRISRKEWHRLQKSGELEQIKEERAANRELAESKAQIIELQAEREKRPVDQVQPVQKSEQVKQEPVSPVKPVVAAVPPPTQREARPLPPQDVKKVSTQQPDFDLVVRPIRPEPTPWEEEEERLFQMLRAARENEKQGIRDYIEARQEQERQRPERERLALIERLKGITPPPGAPPSQERMLARELEKRPDISADRIREMLKGNIVQEREQLRRETKAMEQSKGMEIER